MAVTADIHLIIGEDDYSTDAAARKIFAARIPEASARATAVETIDAGPAANADLQLASIREAKASAFTPPFLDPVKGTWWRNVGFLPSAGKAVVAQDVKNALQRFAEALAKDPPDASHPVVITAPRLLKTSVFAKTLAKVAAFQVFERAAKPKDRLNAALGRLPELAGEAGVSFAPGADRAFVAKAGTDTRTLVSELNKLATWLGEEKRPVTAADVDEVTSPALDGETEIWAVQDALANHDAAAMIRAVRALQGDRSWAIPVVQVLINFARDMIVARDQTDRRLPVPGNGWIAQRNAQRCQAFPLAVWRRIRFQLLKLRERLVSSQADDAAVELELLRITKT